MNWLRCGLSLLTLLGGLTVMTGLPGGLASSPGPDVAQEATIRFVNPSNIQVTVGEGDDFAIQVLGKPWDMDQRRDIGYEIGFSNVTVSDSTWQGTFSGVDQASGASTAGYFFPLFQGFSTLVGGQQSQELNWNIVGGRDQYAVDTSKYTLLSFRMYTSQRSQYYVQWTGAKPVTWPTGDHRFGGNDGCYSYTGLKLWPAGWHVYYFDLAQPNGEDAVRAGTWQDQSLVRGLRIDPSASAPAGTQIKVDWVRLTDPSKSPTINLEWTAQDTSPGDTVDIYVADNQAGADASPVVRGIPVGNQSYTFKTSILPAGEYYFSLHLMDVESNGCGVTKASTPWAGPLTIKPAPELEILSPSMLSGTDYATTELGNPWDMNDWEDIITPGSPYPETLTDKDLSDGIFSATALILPGQPSSDSQIWLHTDPNYHPIATTKYRYFSVHLKVDSPLDKDINFLVKNGWGGRVVWWNTAISSDGSETKYGNHYEGWRTYTVDLARAVPDPSVSDSYQADNILTPKEQNPFPAQIGWTQLGGAKYLRFDPLETTPEGAAANAHRFHIDWAKLTAPDEVNSGQPYPIRYAVTAARSVSLAFFYDTDTDPSNGRSVIGTETIQSLQAANVVNSANPSGAGPSDEDDYMIYLPVITRVYCGGDFYVWDTTGVPVGTYYICIEAEDAYNTVYRCSDAPMILR